MSRRGYAASDVSSRYDDRYERRGNGRPRGHEERYYEEEEIYQSRGPPRRAQREEIVQEEIRIRERSRERSPPPFMREDYGRTTAGPVVLRAREREEFEFAPRPRRRSPSPEVGRVREREEIIIRRDESESSGGRRDLPPPAPIPPPVRDRDYGPPARDYDREEIIIRRDERESDRRPPIREVSREREEIIIRRDEGGRKSVIEADYERDDFYDRRGPPPRDTDRNKSSEEIIIRRDERDDDRLRPGRGERDREEIIIRRDEREDDREPRYGGRRRDYDDYAPARPKSHERERSRPRGGEHEHDDEIIIRRDEREGGRGGDREREEIIIRRHSRSRSPSPAPSLRPAPEPPIIRAPPIHQEVITHHRHIDHGYEMALAPRQPSRAPSPAPPPPAPREEERIEIQRHGVRNGRAYDEDIIIDRQEGGRGAPGSVASRPPPPPMSVRDEPIYDAPARRPYRDDRYGRDVQEEAEYYNNRALERSYPGEAYRGATRDWAIVDVPPGTSRVRMDGVGGGEQEITWQRYNGVRRSKFLPDGGSDEGYGSGEIGRPMPSAAGEIGGRYGRQRDPKEGLWTEITKDLVVKDALTEMGYEYEETEDFYYVFQFLRYEDVSHLVGLSEDIKKGRRSRIQQLEWESRLAPPEEERRDRLAIEAPPLAPRSVYDDVEERYIERDIVYRGGRPPPAPRWGR